MKIKSITIKCDALLLKQRKIGISDRRYPVIMGVPLSKASRNYLEQHDLLKGLHYDAFRLMSANIDSMTLINPFMENTNMLYAFQDACNAVLYGKSTSEEKAEALYNRFNELLGS